MSAYVLTDDAEADLRSIIRYTRKTWGVDQVRRYVAALELSMARIANSEGGFSDMSSLYPGLRMARCGHHYVFCLPRKDAPAWVVAILHERMDLLARVIDRL